MLWNKTHIPSAEPSGTRVFLFSYLWQPTPVFLPGEFHGRKSLVGYSPWGRKESDPTKQLTHTLIYTDLPGNHFALIYFLVFKSTCIVIEVKFVRSDWTNRKSGCGQSGKPTAGFLLRLPSQRKSNMELMFMLRTGEGSLMRRCITATHFKPLVLPSSPFGVLQVNVDIKRKGNVKFNLELGENPHSLSRLCKQHENVLLPGIPFEAGVPVKVLKISMCFSDSSQLPRHLGCLEFWLRADIHHGRQSRPRGEWPRVPAMLLSIRCCPASAHSVSRQFL